MAPNTEKGSDGKPKGLTRTHLGYLQQREDSDDAWEYAVRHSEIRGHLIDDAALLGDYRFPPRAGPGRNVTSFLEDIQQWGPDRPHRAPLIFQLRKTAPPSTVPETFMTFADQIVLDQNDHRIPDFLELPATLSTELEGHHIELFLRQNDKIEYKDLIARMPEPLPGVGALRSRARRFQLKACCLHWDLKPVSQAMNAQIESILGPACVNQNSSRPFGRDFNHREMWSIVEASRKEGPANSKHSKKQKEQQTKTSGPSDSGKGDVYKDDHGNAVLDDTIEDSPLRTPIYSETFTMSTRYGEKVKRALANPSANSGSSDSPSTHTSKASSRVSKVLPKPSTPSTEPSASAPKTLRTKDTKSRASENVSPTPRQRQSKGTVHVGENVEEDASDAPEEGGEEVSSSMPPPPLPPPRRLRSAVGGRHGTQRRQNPSRTARFDRNSDRPILMGFRNPNAHSELDRLQELPYMPSALWMYGANWEGERSEHTKGLIAVALQQQALHEAGQPLTPVDTMCPVPQWYTEIGPDFFASGVQMNQVLPLEQNPTMRPHAERASSSIITSAYPDPFAQDLDPPTGFTQTSGPGFDGASDTNDSQFPYADDPVQQYQVNRITPNPFLDAERDQAPPHRHPPTLPGPLRQSPYGQNPAQSSQEIQMTSDPFMGAENPPAWSDVFDSEPRPGFDQNIHTSNSRSPVSLFAPALTSDWVFGSSNLAEVPQEATDEPEFDINEWIQWPSDQEDNGEDVGEIS